MNNLIPICCQEKCPLGKRCCFGEVYAESLASGPIRERHKCEYHKITGKKFVDTETRQSA